MACSYYRLTRLVCEKIFAPYKERLDSMISAALEVDVDYSRQRPYKVPRAGHILVAMAGVL